METNFLECPTIKVNTSTCSNAVFELRSDRRRYLMPQIEMRWLPHILKNVS